ncbi:FAD-dependent oxidoreductase [Humitalea sp. 24SJ18S-53]|uniref:FAD-dependent oxidoreductase n=1 Tax=Humitalea sp. 24SJ18S-53 TaxID=3422307 RepID=UPI003D6640D9
MHVPVLIVGGGPVGLTLGIDLAWRGIRCLLLEERAGSLPHPKATLLGARSMELFRRWGLDDAIYDAGIRQNDGYHIIFADRMAGHLLHRFSSPGSEAIRARDPATIARFRELGWSPYGKTQIGQQALEPVLLRHARTLPDLDLRHGTRLVSFTQTAERVEAVVEDVATGQAQTITADHMVACDGGGSGIRKALGIGFSGRGRLRSNVSFFFRAENFLAEHGKGLANLAFTFTPDAFGVFTAIDGKTLWNYQHYWADPTRDDAAVDATAILHRAMGKPFAFELLRTTHWHHHQSVAQHWRSGRVFLAGDAAHLFVPTGGVGMNTGIGDAADLAWKLAAVHQGWGGPRLLDAYESERKPIAWRNSVASANNSDRIDAVMAETPASIADDTEDGAAARAALKPRLTWMARQFNSAGLHLGYRYADSPIIVADGTPEPPDDVNQVVPSTWPGSRAPHLWLHRGTSTLDLFGQGFTLLRCGPSAPLAPRLLAALRARGMPVETVRLDDPAAVATYATPLVLVRPDGHVGWRGAFDPDCADTIADHLRGA